MAAHVAVLLGSTPAWCWGREGHRVVAKIAAKGLTPAVRSKVAAIFGVHVAGVEAAMANAATWPDEIDKKGTGTGDWHFVDVPIGAPFSTSGLCSQQHPCVVDQIEDLQRRLRTNASGFVLAQRPRPFHPMTWQELAFLIHFVGDIHQPLHAATDGDRGGNCITLTHPLPHSSGQPTTELHAAWDVDEVDAVLAKLGNEDASATALFERSKNGTVDQLTTIDWAHESNDMAKADIYGKLGIPVRTAPPGTCAAGITNVEVDQPYLSGNANDVEQRLMLAGVRLSNLLNQICAGSGCKAKPHGTH